MKRVDKTVAKRTLLIERTARALGVALADAEKLLRIRPRQSFRLRGDAAVLDALKATNWVGEPIGWMPGGHSIEGDKRVVSDSVAATSGDVYVQNAASWLPVMVLDVQSGDKVLDVCAAPGGKAIHLFDQSAGSIELWVNDNSFPRMKKLQANFSRMGILNYRSSLHDATRLSRHLPNGSFDRILLDAPCSGEGMMNIEKAKDFLYWSPSQIKRLQSQQKQLLREAWSLLKPGGRLVYSTCTIAPEENEAVVDYALRRLEGVSILPIAIELPNRVSPVSSWNDKPFDEQVGSCMRLIPAPDIEAFFVAVFQKDT